MVLSEPFIIQSRSNVEAKAEVAWSSVNVLLDPVTSMLRSESSAPYVFVGST